MEAEAEVVEESLVVVVHSSSRLLERTILTLPDLVKLRMYQTVEDPSSRTPLAGVRSESSSLWSRPQDAVERASIVLRSYVLPYLDDVERVEQRVRDGCPLPGEWRMAIVRVGMVGGAER